MSGGGFRATLFHLGALRRLNELGLLKWMDTISSVSGGSIINGLCTFTFNGNQSIKRSFDYTSKGILAGAWKDLILNEFSMEAFELLVAKPIYAFCRNNIATNVVIADKVKLTKWVSIMLSIQIVSRIGN